MSVNCHHWSDCGLLPRGGCCALGLFNDGKVGVNICKKVCRKRVRIEDYDPVAQTQPIPPHSGVGTELKKLLAKFWIKAGGCGCNGHAAQMDRWGPGLCEQNRETILDWMQAEAQKRKLPFVRAAAALLVRRAITNARRNAQATP